MKVNIGGQQPKAGWKILNVSPADYVDFVRNCTDLSIFEDNSVDEFYASHVLEHLNFVGEIQLTLNEIHRALVPGGVLRISVPDLDVLCRLFLDRRFTPEVRTKIMRMIFGGQIDAYDYHKIGLNWEILGRILTETGFNKYKRVKDFDLFDDTSGYRIEGQLISLNVIATKD